MTILPSRFTIQPHGAFRISWDVFISIVVVAESILVPFDVGFGSPAAFGWTVPPG